MSDKEALLSMGFAEDRVDWALRATQNRGLQPAMDHILENNDNPVPDLTTQASSAPRTSAPSAMALDNEDEDDAAAIRAALGKASANVAPASGSEVSAEAGEAKSIKCTQCEKVFKNVDLANYHAEKSGHDQFEESTDEIKPLTEDEKKQKLEELRAKMAEKKTRKAAEDAKENKANELLRRRPERTKLLRRKSSN